MSKKDATAYARQPRRHADGRDHRVSGRDGTHGAMPSDEYDGDEALAALEIDPWQ